MIHLKAERLNRGLSVRVLAAQIGVPAHVLRYAENGGKPLPENAKLIADFYDVKVTDLWPIKPPSEVAA